jgi:hypothetical protein
MSEVDFGSTGMAWNRGSCFWHDWNGLERKKYVLVLSEELGMAELFTACLQWHKLILA